MHLCCPAHSGWLVTGMLPGPISCQALMNGTNFRPVTQSPGAGNLVGLDDAFETFAFPAKHMRALSRESSRGLLLRVVSAGLQGHIVHKYFLLPDIMIWSSWGYDPRTTACVLQAVGCAGSVVFRPLLFACICPLQPVRFGCNFVVCYRSTLV